MADKMMRVAGRYSPKGGQKPRARAMKVDGDGNVGMTLSNNAVEVVSYSKNNPLPPRVEADYELRDTENKYHYLPQITDYTGNIEHRVFEQAIVVTNDLDVDLRIGIGYGFRDASNIVQKIGVNSFITKEIVIEPNGYVAFMPEHSGDDMLYSNGKTVEVPELRTPVGFIVLKINAQKTPTTGEIKILSNRRF